MPKHPKPTAEPPTAPIRLTPQEIVELRESAHPTQSEARIVQFDKIEESLKRAQ